MILGLDTSTSRLSVALRHDGQTLVIKTLTTERRHNETLIPLLDEILREQGRTPSALTGVAVGLGPGSFTGIRIGIATALGLTQALSSKSMDDSPNPVKMTLGLGKSTTNLFFRATSTSRFRTWLGSDW